MSFISYAQNFEDVMLWRALGYVGQGFYIDVGANAPEADSVTKCFYDQGWSGINIEPMAEHMAELRAARPRDINLQLAVGAEAGEITLYEPDVRGWATVATEVAQRHGQQGVPMRTTLVPLMPLTAICEKYAPTDIHFLKIDVEGYEKQALEGMDFQRFRPWIVVVEAVIPHQHGTNNESWEAPLLNNRYRAVYFDGLNRFYLAEEHAALEVAFRAPPNVFDEFERLETFTAKQALANTHTLLVAKQEHLSHTQEQLSHTQEQLSHTQVQLSHTQEQLSHTQKHLNSTQALLEAERIDTAAALAAARHEAAHFRGVADLAYDNLNALHNSRSWKITRPIRWVGMAARQVKQALLEQAAQPSVSTPQAPEAQPVPETKTSATNSESPTTPTTPATPTTPTVPPVSVRRSTALQPATLYRPLAAPESLRLALPNPSDVPPWYRLTGHAEGPYSLAVVNRGLLRSLSRAHPEHVALNLRDGDSTSLSTEAPEWLQQLAVVQVPPEVAGDACSIVHHYPLITDSLPAGVRLALFFWEETAVPAAMVGHLETHFDAVLVASQFVKRALRNSGCSLPIQVIPLGVDHLATRSPEIPTSGLQKSEQHCRFLHVSSVFERKGPDLLLQAWLRQFSGDDPVELYIKTFPNPHNRIHALWRELSAAHPNPPRVIIDEETLDEAQMLALYRSAQAMVLPTRGEGFNLPAAEAMALGIALLVTGHGAHADFCNLETAALIPFLFAASGSHLKTGESCWVEPDLDSLTEQLGILYREILADAPSLLRRRTAAMQHVRQTYSWSRSAEAIDRFAAVLNKQRLLKQKTMPAIGAQINLHVLSPWHTACGIAEYAHGLISAFRPDQFRIHFDCDTRTPPASTDVANDPSYAPTWTLGDGASVVRTLQRIGERAKSGDVVLVQHQPGLFRLDTPICEQLSLLSRQGLVVLLEMHATRPLLDHQRPPLEALDALRLLDRIIVHHLDDLNHLLMLGLDDNLMQIPHGVVDPLPPNQTASRASLGLPDDALILASFGFLQPHKGIDQIIAALPTIAAKIGRKVCLLAINALPDPSRHQLQQQYQQLANALGVADDVRWIVGYQDIQQSLRQLACADFILFPYANTQESASGAVTIGLATNRPVLVSNQPIFADLSDMTWRMNGHDAAAIAQAVCTLHADPGLTQALQARQQAWLGQRSWQNISARLARAVIGCHRDKTLSLQLTPAVESLQVLARQAQLLVDVSELYHRDARTGIQRVVRNILQELQHDLTLPILAGYQVLPVFAVSGKGYCHTRRFDQTARMANNLPQENEPVQPEVGDIFLGLDLSAHLFPEAENWLRDYRRRGVAIHFVVYDIIPLRNPQWTSPGMTEAFGQWLLSIARQSHRLLCISATVAADVHGWLIQHAPEQTVPDIVSFPLGADLLPQSVSPTPANHSPLPDLQGRSVFLSVGTIEPRKGQAQTLAAFEQLWAEGQDVVLVLVGKIGWMMDDFVERLTHHPESGRHLFWLPGLNDSALEEVYAQSTALIAASEAEGFGLPLIEAARHRLPIIARNIAVFREVAGRHAFYFSGCSAGCLARAIQYWQVLRQQQHHPASDGMHWLNWQQSAHYLQALLKSIKPV